MAVTESGEVVDWLLLWLLLREFLDVRQGCDLAETLDPDVVEGEIFFDPPAKLRLGLLELEVEPPYEANLRTMVVGVGSRK